jgi:transposase
MLDYAGDKRKLYAFALVEGHSRMLYLEFTHSQSFETFARCHAHAFLAMGGVAREIAYDNLATAVAEHDGRLVRFLPGFLAFARGVWLLSQCLQPPQPAEGRARYRVYAPSLLAAAGFHGPA